jgi:hypothetical protein
MRSQFENYYADKVAKNLQDKTSEYFKHILLPNKYRQALKKSRITTAF